MQTASKRYIFNSVVRSWHECGKETLHLRTPLRQHRPRVHHDDHEICWVLKGRLRITLPQEIRELREGQSIQFDAIQEHTYEALEDCQFMIVHIRKDKRY